VKALQALCTLCLPWKSWSHVVHKMMTKSKPCPLKQGLTYANYVVYIATVSCKLCHQQYVDQTVNIFSGCQPNESNPVYTIYQRFVLNHSGERQCGFVLVLLRCSTSGDRQSFSFSESNYSETTHFPVL